MRHKGRIIEPVSAEGIKKRRMGHDHHHRVQQIGPDQHPEPVQPSKRDRKAAFTAGVTNFDTSPPKRAISFTSFEAIA